MCPHLENYGSDDDLYLVIEDVRPGISFEMTGDGDQFWVSLKGPDGELLDDASINPRSKRDTIYDKHRYSTAGYPEPREDSGTGLHLEPDVDLSAELSSTVYPGQYLTRVDSLTADHLARGTPPDGFPSLDEARSFVAMYVLELPPEPVVDDEPSAEDGENAERIDRGLDSDVARDVAASPDGSRELVEETSDSRQTEHLTLFDLVTEEVFDVSVADFTAHYGVTIWNTGEFWHE
ncbi:hypothetical protein [Salinigranum salinum]|uniref:hypothetical protein n=1 Tax=Salinigranum salinum TaxID=1364937 RepID=UPI001260C51A|nr:hypothetical protein [Salinigranum salinum]